MAANQRWHCRLAAPVAHTQAHGGLHIHLHEAVPGARARGFVC